jgi:hypothetical protein
VSQISPVIKRTLYKENVKLKEIKQLLESKPLAKKSNNLLKINLNMLGLSCAKLCLSYGLLMLV